MLFLLFFILIQDYFIMIKPYCHIYRQRTDKPPQSTAKWHLLSGPRIGERGWWQWLSSWVFEGLRPWLRKPRCGEILRLYNFLWVFSNPKLKWDWDPWRSKGADSYTTCTDMPPWEKSSSHSPLDQRFRRSRFASTFCGRLLRNCGSRQLCFCRCQFDLRRFWNSQKKQFAKQAKEQRPSPHMVSC